MGSFRRGTKSDTNYFLLPVFGMKKEVLKGMGYVDSYIKDKHKAYPIDGIIRIFALFKPVTQAQRQHLNTETGRLEAKGLVVDDYDYADGYTVLVLRLPDELIPDFELFLAGKYSKYSKEIRKYFPMMDTVMVEASNGNSVPVEQLSLQFHVFHKTEGIRAFWEKEFGLENEMNDPDQEFWYKPNLERETLDIDELNKLV